jgi:hypothetical protein
VCSSIAMTSYSIRVDQTEPVGEGRDRFYSTSRTIDATGALVNFAATNLQSVPEKSIVLVLPEGKMVNYLARRRSVEPGWLHGDTEQQLIDQVKAHPPDYIVIMTRNLKEFGIDRFGAPGNFGFETVKWSAANYSVWRMLGGDPLKIDGPPGELILQLKKNQN